MNKLHAITLVQKTVIEGSFVDPKDVFLKLRSVIPNGGDTEVLSRKEIESVATEALQQLKSILFPVEKCKLLLDVKEMELRADLLDALAGVDISNPRDCRDVFETHRQLASSSGEPSLRLAMNTLAAAGLPHEAFKARLDELYPEDSDDDGDVQPVPAQPAVSVGGP